MDQSMASLADETLVHQSNTSIVQEADSDVSSQDVVEVVDNGANETMAIDASMAGISDQSNGDEVNRMDSQTMMSLGDSMANIDDTRYKPTRANKNELDASLNRSNILDGLKQELALEDLPNP